jgi:hypothetical protein
MIKRRNIQSLQRAKEKVKAKGSSLALRRMRKRRNKLQKTKVRP